MHETQTATTFAAAVFAKPLMDKALVWWPKGGIEGLSVEVPALATRQLSVSRSPLGSPVLDKKFLPA